MLRQECGSPEGCQKSKGELCYNQFCYWALGDFRWYVLEGFNAMTNPFCNGYEWVLVDIGGIS
jgi:hypothetical protein